MLCHPHCRVVAVVEFDLGVDGEDIEYYPRRVDLGNMNYPTFFRQR
jgi:hypothetical protein